MRYSQVAVALTVVLFAASSCGGKETTGVAVSVTGGWGGTGVQNGQSISFMMTLQETGNGAITGNGTVTTFTAGGAGLTYTVSGTRSGSSVKMAFNVPNFVSPLYEAEITSTGTMQGAIDGSGFVNMKLRLDRM